MLIRSCWQAKAALFLASSMVMAIATPIAAQGSFSSPHGNHSRGRLVEGQSSQKLVSQSLFDTARVSLPAGTRIQTIYTETGENGEPAEKIVLSPDEEVEITVTVSNSIRSSTGTVLIPAGSEIDGELRPLEDDDRMGTQFYAETLRLPNGWVSDIDAASAPITRTETITEETSPDFLKGAVIGAAAAAVLAEILGSIDVLEVLGGAGLGALGIWIFGGGEKEVDVVVVDPRNDLDVILMSDLQI